MDIINYIPKGRNNAISRTRLRIQTGLSDRAMREEISQARRCNCIINLQNGAGYYIPDTGEEIQRFILQETRRAKSIFWCLKGAKKALKSLKEVGNG